MSDGLNRPFVLREAIALLSRTPATVDALLRGLPETWIRTTEGAGTWSAFDIVGHLLHGEYTDWVPRVKVILSHGESQEFEPFDRFAQLEASKGRTLDSLLDEFAAMRAKNLRELESLGIGIGDLDRRGRHPDFGTVTLRQLLSTWVAHDLDHVMQISRVLARQYAQAVGPWRTYLRIMNVIDH